MRGFTSNNKAAYHNHNNCFQKVNKLVQYTNFFVDIKIILTGLLLYIYAASAISAPWTCAILCVLFLFTFLNCSSKTFIALRLEFICCEAIYHAGHYELIAYR